MSKYASKDFNRFFVHIFNSVLSWEDFSLKKLCRETGLTSREIHILEAVCILSEKHMNTMANVAKLLAVSPGSLTTSVNSIVKKGYIVRSYTPSDRRVIYISATSEGEKVNETHQQIHTDIIDRVREQISDDDFDRIVSVLKLLDKYLLTKNFSRE